MKKNIKFSSIFLFALAVNIIFAQTTNETVRTGIKFEECKIAIESVAIVEEAGEIEPEKENSNLAILKINCTVNASGTMTMIPTLFNICYLNDENRSEISASRGIGLKGIDHKGRAFETWLTDNNNSGDILYLDVDKNEKLEFYLAFDLPEGVSVFDLLIPAYSSTKYL